MRTRVLQCLPATAAFSLVAAFAAAGSLSPPGAPAPTMRSLADISPATTISSLPFTITQPGTYTFSQSLVCPSTSDPAIRVLANDVTLDLNGFTLRGTPGAGNTGILVERKGFRSRNGNVVLFDDRGVDASSTASIALEDITVRQCSSGVRLSSGSLSSVSVDSCPSSGVECAGDTAEGTDITLDDVVVRSVSNGITIYGGCDVSMDDIVVSAASTAGITINGGSFVEMRRGVVSGCGGGMMFSSSAPGDESSISCSSSRFADNTGDGLSIWSPQSNTSLRVDLSSCAFDGNGGSGVDEDCDGDDSDFSMRCVDSSFSSNALCGIDLSTTGDSSSSSLSLHRSISNGCGTKGVVTSLACSSSTMTVACSESESSFNGGDGFHMRSSGTGNTVCGTTSHFRSVSNGGNGVWGDDDCDDADFTLRCLDTTSSSNALDGFATTCTGDSSNVAVSLERCVSSSNKGSGVSSSNDCDDLDFSMRCVDVSCSSNTQDGFSLSSSSGGAGLASSATCTFERCSSSSNGGHGLDMDSDDDGLAMSVRCMDSTCADNQGDGLRLSVAGVATFSDLSLSLERSSLTGNGGDGLSVAGSGGGGGGGCAVRVSSSSCSGNGDDGISMDFGAMSSFPVSLAADDTDCDDNDDDGVYILAAFLGKKGYDYYQACSASRNGGDGVDSDCDDFTAEMCAFDDNGQFGVSVTASSVSLSSSSLSRNAASGCQCTCSSAWSGSQCRMTGNGGNGAVVTAPTISSSSNLYADNGMAGLHATASLAGSGVIHRDIAARNILAGLWVVGDNFDISECRSTGHNRATLATSAGIRVDGTGNQVHGNFVADNDYGVHMVSGTNPLYENQGSSNTNPLFEEAGVVPDNAPSSSASSATNAFSNIGF